MLQNDQMRFFMASADKNGQVFQNWPWNGKSGNPDHYNLLCVSPKHEMHGSLGCL